MWGTTAVGDGWAALYARLVPVTSRQVEDWGDPGKQNVPVLLRLAADGTLEVADIVTRQQFPVHLGTQADGPVLAWTVNRYHFLPRRPHLVSDSAAEAGGALLVVGRPHEQEPL